MHVTTCLKTITVYKLPNISQSKGNQTMKLDRLVQYIKINIFHQKLCSHEAGRLAPNLLYFLKKINMRSKKVLCSLVSIRFHSPTLGRNKNKLYKSLGY